MKRFIVYKHTSPSGKVYIGITSQTSSERWRNGTGYHHNAYFTSAIEKYGWNNFKHEILFDSLSEEEACAKEVELIAYYKSNQREYGYNICLGGSIGRLGVPHTTETKQKISKIQVGRKHTEETKKKMSKSRKGRVPYWCVGVKQSEETKRKRALSLKGKCSGKFVGGNSVRAKRINQYDINGEYIKTWEASTDIQRELNIHYTGVIKCCNKQRKTAGGFVWRYADV